MRWIACRLEFRGRRRHPLLQPGRYTELFFLDEATALAAGHRPCALCRREDYEQLADLWRELHPGPRGAAALDVQRHAERVAAGTRGPRLHRLPVAGLPDGAFVVVDGAPRLVVADALLRWTAAGYVDPLPWPRGGRAHVLTPPSLVALLRTDREPVVPFLHPSATAVGGA